MLFTYWKVSHLDFLEAKIHLFFYLAKQAGFNLTLSEIPKTGFLAYSVGAKSQILSSVAPPRKKNLVTIFSQGHVLGPWKPMFY